MIKFSSSERNKRNRGFLGKAYGYKYLSNYLIKKINSADLDFIKMRKKLYYTT